MTDTFANPSTATGIDYKEINGALLLISVKSVEEGINTVHGPTSAVRADIVILDGGNKGETYEDTLVFPKILQSQTRNHIGSKVLGRLGQGVAKPGQSAPWILAEATEDDRDAARKYLAYVASQHIATPTPATTPW